MNRFLGIALFLTHICLPLFSQYPLSICAIFRNEAPFLKEWIEFHKIQGVQHFFLYNHDSEDRFEEVLAPYILRGEVTLVDWSYSYTPGTGREWVNIQTNAYMDAIEKHREDSKWIAFIDIDEFLFCPTGESLVSFLSRYEEYGGVCVNWLVFGTSHLEDIPEGDPMIEWLTMCSLPTYKLSKRVKHIVRPDRVVGCFTAHAFQYQRPFFAVNNDYLPQDLAQKINGPSICHDEIRINHYWTRTERYFRECKAVSRQHRRAKDTEEKSRAKAAELSAVIDLAIQQFVPLLKERLKK